MKNIRICHLFKPVTQNQYSQHPTHSPWSCHILDRLSKNRGKRKRMSNTRGHPLSWLLSNNRLEKVPFVSVPHTSSNRLLLSNQDKGCTPSVAHFLPLPLGPALLNLWMKTKRCAHTHLWNYPKKYLLFFSNCKVLKYWSFPNLTWYNIQVRNFFEAKPK